MPSAVAVSRISFAENARLNATNSVCTSRALSTSHIPLRRCLLHFLRSWYVKYIESDVLWMKSTFLSYGVRDVSYGVRDISMNLEEFM